MTLTDPLRTQIDNIVDRFFGENVEFHPWAIDAQGGGYTKSSASGPDSARGIVPFVAAECTGSTEAKAAAGGQTELLTSGIWLSVQEGYVDLATWKKGDRLFLKERNQWFELNYIAPSATRRPLIHMIRITK